MPIHDWTRVDVGIFHDFHHAWIEEIKRALNRGLLPPDYYAMAEQITGPMGPDVLTLKVPTKKESRRQDGLSSGGVAVAERPPRARYHLIAELDQYADKANTVVIRHRSGHEVVAMLEIVSPGNKSSRRALDAFAEKATEALAGGIHMLEIDLFPPGSRDPQGMHPAIWGDRDGSFILPPDERLTCAAYVGGSLPEAFVEPTAVGQVAPEMPLFLTPDHYVPVPLETTY